MPTLEWANREAAVRAATRAPFRLLEYDPALSFGDPDNENILIHGDNLEGAKTLMPYFAGRVKCFAIDGPYNTRSAFEHYDDNLEHSTWLSMMYPRLELMRDLLAEDGSIWACIDDNEAHYLKVIMDEVLGRRNFIGNVVWQKRTSPDNRLRLGPAQDNILVYGRREDVHTTFNQLTITGTRKDDFKNPDNDPRGAWASTDFTGMTGHATPSQFYTIVAPNGTKHPPPAGRCWALNEETFYKLVADKRVWFGKDGKARPRLKRFLSEMEGQNAWTWWPNSEVGHNQESKKEINALFSGDEQFDTPKPERLLHRILTIATNPGDIVCDPFLGSGTTAAVAHKMGRRWIGIEMGEHAVTHCAPRLRKVIEGEQGGISGAVNWNGGGGFRFYRLGPAITDDTGRINPAIRFPTLAAHVWFSETHTPWHEYGRGGSPNRPKNSAPGGRALPSPLLGVHKGTAVYLLYNGILGDKKSNALTGRVLHDLPRHDGPKVIFSECTSLGDDRLHRENIIFKHIPYDIKGR